MAFLRPFRQERVQQQGTRGIVSVGHVAHPQAGFFVDDLQTIFFGLLAQVREDSVQPFLAERGESSISLSVT